MSAKSTNNSYGWVPVTIHWVSAILILILLGSGFRAAGLEDVAAKTSGLRVHVIAGILILALTLTRIVWWLFVDRKPDPIPMPSWQDRISRATHLLFYIVILGMTASGIGMLLLSQAMPIILGGSDAVLPNFWDYPPRPPHGVAARLMLALLALHAGAALYHHFFKKDGLLRRMWF